MRTIFLRATMADHLRLHQQKRILDEPFERVLRRFMRVPILRLRTGTLMTPIQELPDLHRGLAACFVDWRVLHEAGPEFYYSGTWAPEFRRLETRPGHAEQFLAEGSRFCLLPDGSRRILSFTLRDDDNHVTLRMLSHAEHADAVERDISRLSAWIDSHHYQKNQVLRPNGQLLPSTEPVTWHDLALADDIRGTLLRNTAGMLQRAETFRRNGIPLRRGILLYGPPGTGKTMIGRVLAQSGLATFIWATGADVTAESELRNVFDLARRLAPTILFFEDLDLYAAERSSADSGVLAEMLSQMDGLERNDGLIVVATTNDLEAIEPALKDRPSRFDVVLRIGVPNTDSRRRILARELQRVSVSEALLDYAAKLSDGLTGAQLREAAVLAIQAAIEEDRIDATSLAHPAAGDVEQALTKLLGRKRGLLGFHRAS